MNLVILSSLGFLLTLIIISNDFNYLFKKKFFSANHKDIKNLNIFSHLSFFLYADFLSLKLSALKRCDLATSLNFYYFFFIK